MLRAVADSCFELSQTRTVPSARALHVRPRACRYSHHRHRAVAPRSQVASASTSARPPGGVRVGTLFLALSILGIGATSVGLYTHYTSLATWPAQIRPDLRSALRCKLSQDYVSSHNFFAQAWEKATSEAFADKLGILKISGIGIAWAEMLEEAGLRIDEGGIPDASSEAYSVLTNTYDWTRERIDSSKAMMSQNASSPQVSEAERVRATNIAVKLASMAEGQPHLEKQTEAQLTWAVWVAASSHCIRLADVKFMMRSTELLRLSSGTSAPAVAKRDDKAILVGELELPPWVMKSDMGATLESLGNFYAGKANVEYAMPLYLQSISLLLPPPQSGKGGPSSSDKCHAATIVSDPSGCAKKGDGIGRASLDCFADCVFTRLFLLPGPYLH